MQPTFQPQKDQSKQGFSKFSWALALLCLPIALWPLALFVSPKFSEHPNLSDWQINAFSIAFWVYPFVLFALSGILHKLHQRRPALAKNLLLLAFALFYGGFVYIIRSV